MTPLYTPADLIVDPFEAVTEDEGEECPLTDAELRDATQSDPSEEWDDSIVAWVERSGRVGENDE